MKSISVLTEKNVSKIEKSLRKLAQAKHRRTGFPLVILKFAQTLDGKIATLTGDSRWISGPSSLRFAHRMRSLCDAILVGVDTIIRDDPRLTVRLVEGKNPLKIILDSRLRTPLGSGVLKGRSATSTIIATTSLSHGREIKSMESTGAAVWMIAGDDSNRVNLPELLRKLGQKDVRLILVEGGSRIFASFLKKRMADHLLVVVAPKIMGKGINCVAPSSTRKFEKLISSSYCRYFQSSHDVIIEVPLK
jgi:diaminohydroxyphosphoribosylaminopyrimidine deaminase/5-amino-6-(5-phosphoribosylamino)uracil reductase